MFFEKIVFDHPPCSSGVKGCKDIRLTASKLCVGYKTKNEGSRELFFFVAMIRSLQFGGHFVGLRGQFSSWTQHQPSNLVGFEGFTPPEYFEEKARVLPELVAAWAHTSLLRRKRGVVIAWIGVICLNW